MANSGDSDLVLSLCTYPDLSVPILKFHNIGMDSLFVEFIDVQMQANHSQTE